MCVRRWWTVGVAALPIRVAALFATAAATVDMRNTIDPVLIQTPW